MSIPQTCLKTRQVKPFGLLISGAILAQLFNTNSPDVHAAPDAKMTRKLPAKPKKNQTRSVGSKRPASVLRLQWHAFPDVTMGMREAYAVMLPTGWKASGHIEWQPAGEVLFPQHKFEIHSPQQGTLTYQPSMTFSYTDAQGVGRHSIPAPANLPQWLIKMVPRANPKIRNVSLVSSRRDAKTEAYLKRMDVPGMDAGMEREVHVVVLDYEEEGVRRREEMNLTYVRFSPLESPGFYSQLWSLSPLGALSAPVQQFAAHRKSLLAVASTVRATPQWHTQSQALIEEMSRQRIADGWERIRARGRQQSQLSEADYAKYKQDMAQSDTAQRARINGIYETDDFKDTSGAVVNLPTHYNHVFSDGKGNYLLSNNSLNTPGAQWKTIRPMK